METWPWRGDPGEALACQPGEIGLDVGTTHLARVPTIMKPNEGFDPMDVSVCCTYAVVQVADALAHLIEQTHRFERRTR